MDKKLKRLDDLSPEERHELTLAMYNGLDPSTQWEEIKAQSERAIDDIIRLSAERAAVMFKHYGFTWKPKDKEFVPKVEDINESLARFVNDILEHGSGGGAGGRLQVRARYENFESPEEVTDIDLYFLLGSIPIQYLHTNAWMIAKTMMREMSMRVI